MLIRVGTSLLEVMVPQDQAAAMPPTRGRRRIRLSQKLLLPYGKRKKSCKKTRRTDIKKS